MGYLNPGTQLEPFQEQIFRLWWALNQLQHGQGANPNTPNHYYDYRGAFQAGNEPYGLGLIGRGTTVRSPLLEQLGEVTTTGERPHWASEHKLPLSPERYLLGESGRLYNTDYEDPEERYGYLIDDH